MSMLLTIRKHMFIDVLLVQAALKHMPKSSMVYLVCFPANFQVSFRIFGIEVGLVGITSGFWIYSYPILIIWL